MLKLSPLLKEAEAETTLARVDLALSGQHEGLEDSFCRDLGLAPVAVVTSPRMREPGGLTRNLALLLEGIDGILDQHRPEGVIVQGDTTTTLAGALSGFHRGLPVFHVEAGLRTSDPTRPFPEEMHRRLLGRLATLHLAPTETARENLLREGVPPETIVVTGNTVIDALRLFGAPASTKPLPSGDDLGHGPSVLLVTLHRRENESHAGTVAEAVTRLAERTDVQVLWVRHGNPTSAAAIRHLGPRVRVIDPLPYAAFIRLLSSARVVLTDSGGIQEEAPALGVPVVVLRKETDRPEGVAAGGAVVAGLSSTDIVRICSKVLDAPRPAPPPESPFGDGHAAPRVLRAITRHLRP